MQCLSRGCLACGLLVGVALSWTPQSSCAAEPEAVKFYTFDQVEIHGTFYPGNKGNKSPCALLLHAIGGNTQQEGWDELAKKLQEKNFAVLTFDFRGHGDSTSVAQDFWRLDRNNQLLKSYKPGKPHDQIRYQDFTTPSNYASLVNDIAAAKRYLDKRNDSNDCNSANVVVIGAESGATLGALWIRTEWVRIESRPFVASPGPRQPEGQGISCAIWLSISPDIGFGKNKWKMPVETWLTSPIRERNFTFAVRDKVPMYFLYGEQDSKSAKFAEHLCERIERNTKIKLTGKKPIKDTKLAGIELIKPSLETEKWVTTYAQKVIDELRVNPWAKKDVELTRLFPVPYKDYIGR